MTTYQSHAVDQILKAAHTPGPWFVHPDRYAHRESERIFAGAKYIGSIGNSDNNRDELLANANLIAASPDLLDALQSTAEALELACSRLGICGHGDHGSRKANVESFGEKEALMMAREAIAKGLGK